MQTKIIKKYFISLLFLLLFACHFNNTPEEEKTLDELYHNAILDAIIADENEIVYNLTPISETNTKLIWQEENGNKFLLVATFTKYPNSYPLNTKVTNWWDVVWVTAVPDLFDWFNNNKVSADKIVLRTEQLLGLPYNSGNEYIVELWVNPSDLLRPAYEIDIQKTSSDIKFPLNTDSSYINWFNANILSSYFPQKTNTRYPWTRLGYTYDWGNTKSEVGLSEFIIKRNSSFTVKSVKKINDYIYN